jgi:hypothetical protein
MVLAIPRKHLTCRANQRHRFIIARIYLVEPSPTFSTNLPASIFIRSSTALLPQPARLVVDFDPADNLKRQS